MTTCNCKTEIEAKLLERFRAQTPAAHDHQVSLEGYGLGIVGNEMVLAGFMPTKFFAVHPSKDGSPKLKSSKSVFRFSFCPFCGQKEV